MRGEEGKRPLSTAVVTARQEKQIRLEAICSRIACCLERWWRDACSPASSRLRADGGTDGNTLLKPLKQILHAFTSYRTSLLAGEFVPFQIVHWKEHTDTHMKSRRYRALQQKKNTAMHQKTVTV
ncbi:hypothetical protein TRVL_09577 [Trypanosoma vivax]|nr:hypothetical protein TRVL_09577 [Trypanosoma vivax]